MIAELLDVVLELQLAAVGVPTCDKATGARPDARGTLCYRTSDQRLAPLGVNLVRKATLMLTVRACLQLALFPVTGASIVEYVIATCTSSSRWRNLRR